MRRAASAVQSAALKLLRGVLTAITLLASVGMLLGAWGGCLSPSDYRGITLMVLSFPLWLIGVLAVSLLDLLWCRKALVISAISLLAASPAIWDFCPLNIFNSAPEKYRDQPQFTLLSYNVLNFTPVSGEYPGGTNPALSFIINTKADIVVLQEAGELPSVSRDPQALSYCTAAQLDSLADIYPYIISSRTQMLMSKFPARAVPIGKQGRKLSEIAAFRVEIDSMEITVIDVHLESYRLRDSDKELFRDVTTIKKDNIELLDEVKSQLISKVQLAAERRENDARRLGAIIKRLGSPNLIVTGDFNDVPGCYTLRALSDYDLRQVYPRVGIGPKITYHSGRFLFRIDHTLYRGDLVPLSVERPTPQCSDHYPLLTTFALRR